MTTFIFLFLNFLFGCFVYLTHVVGKGLCVYYGKTYEPEDSWTRKPFRLSFLLDFVFMPILAMIPLVNLFVLFYTIIHIYTELVGVVISEFFGEIDNKINEVVTKKKQQGNDYETHNIF